MSQFKKITTSYKIYIMQILSDIADFCKIKFKQTTCSLKMT